MILNVICFKNMKVDAFTNPQFLDIEPKKAAVQLIRSMKVNPEKAHPYQNLVMYFIGTFDDESGKFDLLDEPEMLVDCRITWEELKHELLCKTKDDSEETVEL